MAFCCLMVFIVPIESQPYSLKILNLSFLATYNEFHVIVASFLPPPLSPAAKDLIYSEEDNCRAVETENKSLHLTTVVRLQL